MRICSILALGLIVLTGAVAADAAPEGWHKTLDKGLEAAKKSGKPVLVITAWSRKL